MKICPKCNNTFNDDDMFCDVCGTRLENAETVVTVEAEVSETQPKKKGLLWWHILLIVVSVLVVAGIVVAVVFFVGKDDEKPADDESVTELDEEESSEEEITDGDESDKNNSSEETSIVDIPVAPEVTTKDSGEPAEKPDNRPVQPDNNTDRPGSSGTEIVVPPSTVDAFIDAFIDGKFYMATYNLESGSNEKAEIAKDGNNFQMSIESDGMKMRILCLNGVTYLVNQNNKYIDLNSILELLGDESFDMQSITAMADMIDVSKYDFRDVETGTTTLNGEKVSYEKHIADDATLCFYFTANNVRQIELDTNDDASSFSFAVDEYSATIPSGMLTLSGLTQSNLFEFALEMMQ